MNIPLLRKVQKAILAEPRKFDMRMWFIASDQSPCGTTACIAGHAVALSRKWKRIKQGLKMLDCDTADIASQKLALNLDESARLFHLSYWPSKFYTAHYATKGVIRRAKIAARRIDHFIKTEGRE